MHFKARRPLNCNYSFFVRLFSFFSLSLFVSSLCLLPVSAANNETVNFQGKIVIKTDGTNISATNPACVLNAQADTCDFRVGYYSAATGGASLYTEEFSNVELGNYNGVFSLAFGAGTKTGGSLTNYYDVFVNNDAVYVSLELDATGAGTFTSPEVFTVDGTNRMPIRASAYAIVAAKVAATNNQFVKNQTGVQTSASFNIDGSGEVAGNFTVDNTDDTLFVNSTSNRVGIGTASPNNKLHVAGALQSFPNSGQMTISDTAAVGAGIGGMMTFGGYYTGTTHADWAGIGGFKTNATDGDYSGYLSLYTRANGVNMAERMRISSLGNVGIGTTSADASLLTLNAPDATTVIVELQTSGSSTTVTTSGDAFSKVQIGARIEANGIARKVTAKASSNSITVDSAVDWSAGFAFTYANPIFSAQYNNTSRFMIGADGAVTINTTPSSAGIFEVGGVSIFRPANDGRKVAITTPSGEAGMTFENTGVGAGRADIRFDGTTFKFLASSTGIPSATSGIQIGNTGIVGIGVVPNASYWLTIAGNAAKPGGGSWSDSSDMRIKKEIAPLTGALSKLTSLNGVSFKWVNPEEHGGLSGTQGGFIAQQVAEVFPEWVGEIDASGADKSLVENGKINDLTLSYQFDALVVESIKELAGQVSSINSKTLIGDLFTVNAGGDIYTAKSIISSSIAAKTAKFEEINTANLTAVNIEVTGLLKSKAIATYDINAFPGAGVTVALSDILGQSKFSLVNSDNAPIFSVDSKGDVRVLGKMVFGGAEGTASVGSILIPAETSVVTIDTTAVTPESKVFLSVTDPNGIIYPVVKVGVKELGYFEILVDREYGSEFTVDWWVIN